MLSDASYRFMRGVDAELAEFGSRRAAKLMVELAGAKLLAGVVDVRAEPKKPWKVVCRPARLEALLGLSAKPEEIAKVFESLELKVLRCSPDAIEVQVPTFREDLTREADLIEEYARLHIQEAAAGALDGDHRAGRGRQARAGAGAPARRAGGPGPAADHEL